MDNKIRRARKAAHITQEQLAKLLGINRATLSRYETGDIDLTLSQLVRIAEELEISPTALLPDSMVESWESGKNYGSEESIQKILEYGYRISNDEMELVNLYWDLNKSGREKAIERVRELGEIPRYLKPSIVQGEVSRYQRPAAPETTPPARAGEDTTPPSDAPETPSEGK